MLSYIVMVVFLFYVAALPLNTSAYAAEPPENGDGVAKMPVYNEFGVDAEPLQYYENSYDSDDGYYGDSYYYDDSYYSDAYRSEGRRRRRRRRPRGRGRRRPRIYDDDNPSSDNGNNTSIPSENDIAHRSQASDDIADTPQLSLAYATNTPGKPKKEPFRSPHTPIISTNTEQKNIESSEEMVIETTSVKKEYSISDLELEELLNGL